MEWFTIVGIIVGSILIIVGLIGCFIPILPGPPISYLALLSIHFMSDNKFSSNFLILWFIITIFVTVLDYIVPIAGAKKMGGTKYGVWGSTIGLFLGIFFFPPLGLILGPVLGAWVGELLAGKSGVESLRAAMGSFIGFLLGTAAKLFVSLAMSYYFIEKLIF